MTELLTVEEAASILRVSDQTVIAMCKRDELPNVKIGRLWRINADALRDMLKLPKDKGKREAEA